MKRFHRQSVHIVLCVVCFAMILGCHRNDYWERTLAGPFQGEVFGPKPTTQPSSSVELSPGTVLGVHWENGSTNDPVLCLRESDGRFAWGRVLVPRLQGKEERVGRILDISLKKVVPTEEGYKVFLVCDWTAGGKERGIIYLDTNRVLRSFALSW